MNPILYSFRRCPYAMRARLAIKASKNNVELREVALRNKPSEMIKSSPKATVPVLVLPGDKVIDESLDIMLWALQENDPQNWLDEKYLSNKIQALIYENDTTFKQWLDKYKYHDRYPEHPMEYYRDQSECFLHKLNNLLEKNKYLQGENIKLSDIAIFPFIRQFAHTDKDWFYSTKYYQLQKWLNNFLESALFEDIMKKYKPWQLGEDHIFL